MAKERPLSPHLMIYRPQLTSMMSISHRLSGAALTAGSLLLVWWVVALASGAGYYSFVQGIMLSLFGRLVLFGFTAAVFYHLSNGIRHLFWDFGIGLTIEGVYRSGYMVMGSTLVLTLGLWFMILFG
ncbi:MAG: succinate dehydrogenase, cytochrome b556 subunit [Alphaproteobacteria bacterium]|nr:succinate dehydrogenase, cytochrome b556 subunit [Alphaproteobacteria bacterium]